jgi:hypothetical protein
MQRNLHQLRGTACINEITPAEAVNASIPQMHL